MKHFKSISEFHDFRDLPKPQHPLISVIDVENVKHLNSEEPETLAFDFYCIAVKRMSKAKVKYGQKPFDFNEGIMSFMSPNQVFSIGLDKKDEVLKQSGWVLFIHPDFIWNTSLAKTIKDFDFWDYSLKEALFLSAKEEAIINNTIQHILQEYHSNIDRFSKQIIISQIESLLFLLGIKISELLESSEKLIDSKMIHFNPNKHESTQTSYLTRKQVATLLKISLPTLNEWTRSGWLKSYRIGNRVLNIQGEI